MASADTSAAIGTSTWPTQRWVTIDGADSPGVCTIRGADTPRLWDKRKGPYIAGAYLIPQGNDLAKFSIDIQLWDLTTHPGLWAIFAQVLKRAPPGKPPVAVTIDHPALVWPPLEIRACVILNVSTPEQSETGGWTITIECQEYRGPVLFVPKAADTPDVKNAPPKAKDAADVQIQALMDAQNIKISARDKLRGL